MRIVASCAFVLSILAVTGVEAADQTVAERDGQCDLAAGAAKHILLAASSPEQADLAKELYRRSLAVLDNFCSVRELSQSAEPANVRPGLPSVVPASPDDLRSAAEVVETVGELRDISGSQYSTPTFECAVGYDTCEAVRSGKSGTDDAMLACGFSFLACMGRQLAAVPK